MNDLLNDELHHPGLDGSSGEPHQGSGRLSQARSLTTVPLVSPHPDTTRGVQHPLSETVRLDVRKTSLQARPRSLPAARRALPDRRLSDQGFLA